jgi:esterase/lipase
MAAQEVSISVLVIHCKNDYEVPVFCAENIFNHMKNGELFLTENLGHRKILGDNTVIEKLTKFIKF